ncbi:hypothetical protein PUS82_00245 [Cytobacillus firmus]|uniref:hypothetical protein n=1 Tax=Cytobacillus firmus TaxID=1399 RepID=UPI00237A46B4|nr:hypothetical protein [Cytobacillus firmus]MDD9309761.1 hypothetical protein [Cytobacillus firmus]
MSLTIFLMSVFIFSIIVILINIILIRKNRDKSDLTRLSGGLLVFISSGILLIFRDTASRTFGLANDIIFESIGFSFKEIGLFLLALIVVFAIFNAVRR